MLFLSIGLLRFGGQLHHKQRTSVLSTRDVVDASSLKRSSAAHCSDPVGLKTVDEDALSNVREALLGGAQEYLALLIKTRQEEQTNTCPLVRS